MTGVRWAGLGENARWTVLSAALLAGCGHPVPLRQFEYARPYDGEPRLAAEVEFEAGALTIGPGRPEDLYNMSLRYHADRFRPVGTFDGGRVTLGVESLREGGLRIGGRPQAARIGFSARPDLDLDLALGTGEAEVELGGLRLSRLGLNSGAGRVRLSFAVPNPGSCTEASVAAAAGDIRLDRIGDSGCGTWRIDGGVGKVTIDLDGDWHRDGRIVISQGVGGVTLIAPARLGLRVTLAGLLTRFAGDRFARSGKSYTSEGYQEAVRHLEVDVRSAIGAVRVEWR